MQTHFRLWRSGISSGHEGGVREAGLLLAVEDCHLEAVVRVWLTAEASGWMQAQCEVWGWIRVQLGP